MDSNSSCSDSTLIIPIIEFSWSVRANITNQSSLFPRMEWFCKSHTNFIPNASLLLLVWYNSWEYLCYIRKGKCYEDGLGTKLVWEAQCCSLFQQKYKSSYFHAKASLHYFPMIYVVRGQLWHIQVSLKDDVYKCVSIVTTAKFHWKKYYNTSNSGKFFFI